MSSKSLEKTSERIRAISQRQFVHFLIWEHPENTDFKFPPFSKTERISESDKTQQEQTIMRSQSKKYRLKKNIKKAKKMKHFIFN